MEMMREVEKSIADFKEELKRKIAENSFIRFFEKHTDVSKGPLSNDNCEEISLDAGIPPMKDSENDSDNDECLEPFKSLYNSEDVNKDVTLLEIENIDIVTIGTMVEARDDEVVNIENKNKDEYNDDEYKYEAEKDDQVEDINTLHDNDSEKHCPRIVDASIENKVASDDLETLEQCRTSINEDDIDPHSIHITDNIINKDDILEAKDVNIEDVNISDEKKSDKDINNNETKSNTLLNEVHESNMSDKDEIDSGGIRLRRLHDYDFITRKKSVHMIWDENLFKQEDEPTIEMIGYRQLKGMWSETSEVVDSGILLTLSKKQIQYQETMFEMISSEASYNRSLKILMSHFFESDLFKFQETRDSLSSPHQKIQENKDFYSPSFFKTQESKDSTVSMTDRHHIFSNVSLLLYTSQKFLKDLENRWSEQKPLLTEVCDILLTHASDSDFQNYVIYLQNQEYQNKALRRLTENDVFRQQLTKLENSPVAEKLPIDSYLMQPMHRLTKLKLLVEALLKLMYSEELRVSIPEANVKRAEMALQKLKMLLDESEFQKGLMDEKSMLLLMMNRIDFPPDIKIITISERQFIKEDEVKVHQQNPLRHVRKFTKKRQPTISLLLFNDILIVAKKKGTKLLVIDYCDRINVEATETRYKSIASSIDVFDNIIDLDDDSEDLRKSSLNSLVRSKTSLSSTSSTPSISSDERRKINPGLSSSFKSLSLISRTDEQEIINFSFALKFANGQTDIFSIPIVLLATTTAERDSWMILLRNDGQDDGRLHKSISLRQNNNKVCDLTLNKHSSLYTKRKDDKRQLPN